MTTYRSLLEEALESWHYVRQGLIEEVDVIRGHELDFQPAPGSRTARELIHHVAESALMWTEELARPDGDFTRANLAESTDQIAGRVRAIHDRSALLKLLHDSHRDGDRGIREAGELHMLQFIRRFDGELGTRLAWLNHGIDHEMYHRGQLALYVRLLGRTPALTRQIG